MYGVWVQKRGLKNDKLCYIRRCGGLRIGQGREKKNLGPPKVEGESRDGASERKRIALRWETYLWITSRRDRGRTAGVSREAAVIISKRWRRLSGGHFTRKAWPIQV